MSAVDEVLNSIFQEIDPIKEGEIGEAILQGMLLNVPEIDTLLKPEPDVIDSDKIPRLENMSVLGAYVPMSSPGQVILEIRNIRNFFWSLIRQIIPIIRYITKSDLKAGSRFVTMKTYHHEIFHFHCDVFRVLFGSNYDCLIEEALAVAYARIKIAEERKIWNSPIGRMNGIVYELMMDEAFKYTSPGYEDWHNFEDKDEFKLGLLHYIRPGNYQKLLNNNVAVKDLLFGMLGKIQGFEERVV